MRNAQGFFLQFWKGPYRDFKIGKISVVNPSIGKFAIVHNHGIFGQLKKIAFTHTLLKLN